MLEHNSSFQKSALEQRLEKIQAQQNGDSSKAKERMNALIQKPNIHAMLVRLRDK